MARDMYGSPDYFYIQGVEVQSVSQRLAFRQVEIIPNTLIIDLDSDGKVMGVESLIGEVNRNDLAAVIRALYWLGPADE